MGGDFLYAVGRLTGGDAAGVVALVRRIHGEGYTRRELYDAGEIAGRNERGEWISVVARDESGVIGHLALERAPLGPVVELCMGMVLPEHQRRGALERMRDLLLSEGERLGLAGQFVELATDATAAQALANRSATMPCGITLGLWPRPGNARASYIRYFRYWRRPERIRVHVPEHHHHMVSRIYGELGIAFELGEGKPAEGRGTLRIEPHPEHQSVFLQVAACGADVPAAIAAHDFAADELHSAYLELPLGEPSAIELCLAAERAGFSFSGITPYALPSGDALRLQRLKADPQLRDVKLSHPFAQELLDYALAELKMPPPRRTAP